MSGCTSGCSATQKKKKKMQILNDFLFFEIHQFLYILNFSLYGDKSRNCFKLEWKMRFYLFVYSYEVIWFIFIIFDNFFIIYFNFLIFLII